jgi:di/tricarboxylate transporter
VTAEIVLTLTILGAAVLLFITEWLRVDLVALLVLASLALTRLVTPVEAVSGFSNPAVVTVWAVFILSGGLSRTGVANVLGRQVLRLGGQSEPRLIIVIMLTAGVMSAFMNNVGVAALLLPVVLNITRQTGLSRGRLLMPLAFGSLLGGLTTLIGTPPNILANNALLDFGLAPFRFFDFTPMGVILMLTGVLYMVVIGRRLLPAGDGSASRRKADQPTLGQVYELRELLFVIPLHSGSPLVGKTLGTSRLGSALGLNVFGIIRNGRMQLAPTPEVVLQDGDQLLSIGPQTRLDELHGWSRLTIELGTIDIDSLVSDQIQLIELKIDPESSFVGKNLRELEFRRRYGANVLAIMHTEKPLRTNLQRTLLRGGDTLLVQTPRQYIPELQASHDFHVEPVRAPEAYQLNERLLTIELPKDSTLVGKTLAESRLGDAFGLTVLGIRRNGTRHLIPDAEYTLAAGDRLLVQGKEEDVDLLRGLQNLHINREALPDLQALESEQVALVEVMLSPHTTLVGKTLRQLHFREKFGLNVLSIWREGRAFHSDLRDLTLRFGDALLLYGPRERLMVLGSEPDFLVLAEEVQEPPRLNRAPVASLVMVGMVLVVLLGWFPISIAAVVGGTVMVLTGCLTMEEAYRFIDWRAVFLIAGMLPLGIAMQTSGAAEFLAEAVVNTTGELGPIALISGLFLLTTLASQVMPNAVVMVLMAPIAINTAQNLALSPYALVMAVAIAASTSFLSPVGHPSNILVMGPGGYRFIDFVKVGLPLTILALIVTLLVLPVFWPVFLP